MIAKNVQRVFFVYIRFLSFKIYSNIVFRTNYMYLQPGWSRSFKNVKYTELSINKNLSLLYIFETMHSFVFLYSVWKLQGNFLKLWFTPFSSMQKKLKGVECYLNNPVQGIPFWCFSPLFSTDFCIYWVKNM